eukprot:2129782-Rhodomonas_salina.6
MEQRGCECERWMGSRWNETAWMDEREKRGETHGHWHGWSADRRKPTARRGGTQLVSRGRS